jgi:hypothetical protein
LFFSKSARQPSTNDREYILDPFVDGFQSGGVI